MSQISLPFSSCPLPASFSVIACAAAAKASAAAAVSTPYLVARLTALPHIAYAVTRTSSGTSCPAPVFDLIQGPLPKIFQRTSPRRQDRSSSAETSLSFPLAPTSSRASSRAPAKVSVPTPCRPTSGPISSIKLFPTRRLTAALSLPPSAETRPSTSPCTIHLHSAGNTGISTNAIFRGKFFGHRNTLIYEDRSE